MDIFIANFKKYTPLLTELVARDVKTKYRRSVLGVMWTILNPLFMMLVLSIVFSHLFRFDIENYQLYLLSGQVIFNFFSEASNNGMNAIIMNASLIKKVYVPKYVFVLSRTISSVINLMASFSALIVVMLFTRVDLHFTVILSIIPISLLIIISFGVGMILATYAVKFRDIVHLYSIFTTVLLYMTPVIYPISQLPGLVRRIVLLNPLTNILEMFRGFMIYGTMPSVYTTLMAVVPSIVFMVFGCYVFYKNQDSFILNV